jgi:hypothetical protein
MYTLNVHNVAQFSRAIHSACYDQTAVRKDFPVLTYEEGVRFRNCVTKFSVWMPTLKENLRNTAYHYNCEKLTAIEEPDHATDAYKNETERLANLNKHYQL